AEEKIETRAEESAVPLGMAGQMNHAEAAPIRQLHPGMKRPVDGDGTIAEKRTATGFERSADAAGAAVRKGSVDLRLFCGMGVEHGAAELLDMAQMAGVIQVSMSQKDCLDAGPTQADLLERAFEPRHLAGKPGVHQDCLVVRGVVQEMEVSHQSTNRINPVVR